MNEQIQDLSSENETIQQKDTKKEKKSTDWKSVGITIAVILIISMAVSSIVLVKNGIASGAKELSSTFNNAVEEEWSAAYNAIYENAREAGKNEYYTSNNADISVGNLDKKLKLEVLKASDKEIITDDENSNESTITAWLEVEGEGTFAVNLQAAEYIIDKARKHITVRVPLPELTDVYITSTRIPLLEKNGIFNGDYQEGVTLAISQRNAAIIRIEKAMRSNQFITESAKNNAQLTIENIIRQVNNTVPDLDVTVEFFSPGE